MQEHSATAQRDFLFSSVVPTAHGPTTQKVRSFWGVCKYPNTHFRVLVTVFGSSFARVMAHRPLFGGSAFLAPNTHWERPFAGVCSEQGHHNAFPHKILWERRYNDHCEHVQVSSSSPLAPNVVVRSSTVDTIFCGQELHSAKGGANPLSCVHSCTCNLDHQVNDARHSCLARTLIRQLGANWQPIQTGRAGSASTPSGSAWCMPGAGFLATFSNFQNLQFP